MSKLRKASSSYGVKNAFRRFCNCRRRRIYSIGILSMCLSFSLSIRVAAQTIGSVSSTSDNKAVLHITGSVYDSSNNPIPDASIVVQGSKKNTFTDNLGSFSLDVKKGDILIVSHIGYLSKNVQIGDEVNYKIQLSSNTDDKLGDVVVVAFGNKQKKTLLESISVVGESAMKNRPVNNLLSALQGQAPGLNIVSSSGQPGIAPSLNIRGVGSINSSTSPLIIVDGVPGSISLIDPNDVESVSILKDASASSLYGARAANGVILITTKKGKLGKVAINYSGYVGWQKPTELFQEANAYQYANAFNQATLYDLITPTNTAFDTINNPLIFSLAQLQGWKSGAVSSTNWRKTLFDGNNGFTQSHYINISGGLNHEDLTLRNSLSFGYLQQNGNVANTGYKRYSIRTNNQLQWKRFTANISIGLISDNRSEPSSKDVGNFGSIISAVNRQRPVDSIRFSNGGWNGSTSTNDTRNPVRQALEGGYFNPLTNNILVNANVGYNVWDNLTIKYTMGVSYNFYNSSQFQNTLTWANSGPTTPSNSTMTNYQDKENMQQVDLSYNKTIQKHHFEAIVGYQQNVHNYQSTTLSRSNFINNSSNSMQLGDPSTQTNLSSQFKWVLDGFFGRFNYDFDQKYLFEFNIRRDASSRLNPLSNTDVFPSAAVGWRLSEESFWSGLKKILPEFKLRASYGTLGNANVATSTQDNNVMYYSYNSIIGPIKSLGLGYNLASVFDGTITNAFTLIQNPNNSLKWERTTMTDIAIEGTILSNKLNYSLGYFNKTTNRMLLQQQVSDVNGVATSVGVGSQPQFPANLGSMYNRGIELSLGYSNSSSNGFSYSLNGNYSYITNKITDLGGQNLLPYGVTKNTVGYPVGSYYLYINDGLLTKDEFTTQKSQDPLLTGQKWGDQRIKDINGDGKITSLNQVMVNKNGTPKNLFGLNFDVSYKGIGVAGMLQGATDYYKYLGSSVAYGFNSGYSITDWTISNSYNPSVNPDNYNTRLPRVSISNSVNNRYPSTLFLFNSSYMRLKNLQVYYDLPSSYLQKIHMKKLRFYASGQNLFTWSKLPKALGIDPEVSSPTAGYPLVKIYTLGVNVSF